MRKLRFIDIRLPLAVLSVASLSLGACDRASSASDSVAYEKVSSARAVGSMPMNVPTSARGIVSMNRRAGVSDAAASSPSASSPASEASPEVGEPLPPSSDPAGAMLVRHGQASVEVRHVDDAVLRVRQAAQQLGGFVANTALRNGKDEQPSASLEIRVPTGQFDQLMNGLKAFGRVESVSANAEDVGEEYVDLGARAANARRVEARLVEMLASRTGKLSDVLTVEQELARVRQEIERHDARLRWLERRASLSSFTITLHEPLALIDRTTNGPIVEAFAVAWQRLVGVTAWCIASLGLIVPVGLLAALVALVASRTRRRPHRDGGSAPRPSSVTVEL